MGRESTMDCDRDPIVRNSKNEIVLRKVLEDYNDSPINEGMLKNEQSYHDINDEIGRELRNSTEMSGLVSFKPMNTMSVKPRRSNNINNISIFNIIFYIKNSIIIFIKTIFPINIIIINNK